MKLFNRNAPHAATAQPTRRKWAAAVGCIAAVTGLSLVLASCAGGTPKTVETQTTTADATESTDFSSSMSNFTDRDTGLYPDTTWNNLYLNAGNRGCNSCHEDLSEVMCVGRDQHPIEREGNTSTHKTTVTDGCLNCHDIHSADYGMYFADAIHTAHASSKTFTQDLGGNCWSCHAVTDTSDLTQLGTYDFKLWEEVQYDGALGGYPDLVTNPNTRLFMNYIGHETGTPTDVSTDADATMSVDMSQDISTQEDSFTALNHNATYGEDDLLDYSHTLTLTGVKNPRTFTYDELAAMPQTTIRATNQCVVAGSNGHNIYNSEYTGVSLQYLVDQCGGLADGANQAYITAWDEWTCCWLDQRVENYVDHGLIALKMNGEDLPYEFGGPMGLVAPGVGGAFWCKWPKSIDFTAGEKPYDFVESFADSIPGDELNYVSGAWFENDGVAFSKNDGVTLKGYAYAYATSVAKLSAIEFSTDLGVTWQRFDVPADMDPYQWVTYTFHWQPKEAGTYIVKVRGVNANGAMNETDGSVIVTVTE